VTADPRHPSPPQPAKPISSLRYYLVAAAFVLLLFAATAIWFWRFKASPHQVESIAVLPFASANPDADFLTDGLTESVIASLAHLPDLKVKSRSAPTSLSPTFTPTLASKTSSKK
jgi:hypothetical protein